MSSMSIDLREVAVLGYRIGQNGAHATERAKRALRKTTIDIVADSKLIAQEKDILDTGDLINSIGASYSDNGMTSESGPTVDYGIYQELGTSTQPGRPYMGPAFDRNEPNLDLALAQIPRDLV